MSVTNQWLGDKVGVDQSTVAYWRHAKSSMTVEMLAKVAEALGKPMSFFTADAADEDKFAPTVAPRRARTKAEREQIVLAVAEQFEVKVRIER